MYIKTFSKERKKDVTLKRSLSIEKNTRFLGYFGFQAIGGGNFLSCPCSCQRLELQFEQTKRLYNCGSDKTMLAKWSI